MSKFLADLIRVLSEDDNLVLAAQTSEGIKALLRGVATFAERGGKLEKTANLSAIMFGGAADVARAKLVGGTATEERLGLFLAGLTTMSQSGSVLLGSERSLGKFANATAAASRGATDLFIMHQFEKLTGPAGILPGKTSGELAGDVDATRETPAERQKFFPSGLDPKKTNTRLPMARTISAVAEVGAALSKDESAAQKGLEMAAAAGNVIAQALLANALAESDSEFELAVGASVAESAGVILRIFASQHGELVKVARVIEIGGNAFGRIQATGQQGRLAKMARAQS